MTNIPHTAGVSHASSNVPPPISPPTATLLACYFGQRWPINEVDICYNEGFTVQSPHKSCKCLLGAYREGEKVTANLKGTGVIYPYTPE